MREVLGAQFTEKEGERLIKRAYNPTLSEEENVKRVKRLVEQIRLAAAAKESAAKYVEKKGTLKGWTGKMPSMVDFHKAVAGKTTDYGVGKPKSYSDMTDEELLNDF